MTRFFAKPIVFDIVNKVKRNEVWTAQYGSDVSAPSGFESPIRNAAITGVLSALSEIRAGSRFVSPYRRCNPARHTC